MRLRPWLLVVLLVAVAITALLLFPVFVRYRLVTDARQRGLALVIDQVRWEGGTVRLLDVTATSPEIPASRGHAADVFVEMSGLRPARLTVLGGELTLDGPFERIRDAFITWHAKHQHLGFPERVRLTQAHILWTVPFGPGSQFEAHGVTVEQLGANGADELHLQSPNVRLAFPAGHVGPWSLTMDRVQGEARGRVGLNAKGIDAFLQVSSQQDRISEIQLQTPRGRRSAFGIPASLAGLTEATEVEVKLQVSVGEKVSGTLNLKVYGVPLGNLPPVDVSLALRAEGARRAPLVISNGVLAMGPLSGPVTGTWTVEDDGFVLALDWRGGPVSCDALAAVSSSVVRDPVAELGEQMRQFARLTGFAKVTGNLRAEASVRFDSRDTGATRVSFVPKSDCDVAFALPFGRTGR
ncbi:MAG: hypothetical protein WCI05_00755 [Myxococcales bacterium]